MSIDTDSNINPLGPDPGQREKINLNFYFHSFCGASKGLRPS